MHKHAQIATAMGIYAREGAVRAIKKLYEFGFTFDEAVELMVAFDDSQELEPQDDSTIVLG